MRKIIFLSLAAVSLLTAACNTISGVGRDAESAGKAVTRAAKN